ncbi:MAG: 30S ribosomal protein S17 [Chlamydiia bacterium]|nr:30S ribosomal protein S17 [Chlamydiia bacterium]
MSENQERNRRIVKSGTVVSNKMDKTVVVRVDRTIRHPQYKKIVTVGKKYYAHNDKFQINIGDRVKIMETRPMSKTKCWRVVEHQEVAS